MKESAILILSFLLTLSNFAQNKPDGFIIKNSFPENPTVSIRNDVYNPESVSLEKKYITTQNIKPNENSLYKSNFDIDAFQTIVHSGSEQYLGHCVVTERTGGTAGTIWVVAGVRSSPAGNDWLGIFKLEQNGWTLQTAVFTQQYLGYHIDAELIEKDTGEKVLWMVTTTQQSTFAKWEVYFAGINLFNFLERTTGNLNWPGAGAQDVYYNPMITSDTYQTPVDPWIFIVASLDSLTFDNKHVNAQKLATIILPYNVSNMQILYRESILPVYWPNGGTLETHYLYSDIAYYRLASGDAGLIFTYSNVPEDTKIWLSTCTLSGYNAQFLGTIEGHGNYKISSSAISSPGGNGSSQLMVVFEENYLNSGDWDLVSARSNDLGSTWYLNYIDGYSSTTDKIPHLGTIVSRMGVEDEYYVSYSLDLVDSIMSTKSNNGTSTYWDQKVRMDGIYPTTNIYSSVGITNTPDERVTVWSSLIGGSNFNLIGSFWPNLPSAVEDDTEVDLNSYQLFQNYPNPFNPTTKISWRSPVSSFQSIKVYDVLGNEVAILINEYKPAGNYDVEFNASELSSGIYFYKLQAGEYVETKKMILLK